MLDYSSNSDLSKALILQTKALDMLKSVAGCRVDRVQELCDLVGISKQTLAKAIIWENEGDILQKDLAQVLNIHERTLRKRNWHEVQEVIASLSHKA